MSTLNIEKFVEIYLALDSDKRLKAMTALKMRAEYSGKGVVDCFLAPTSYPIDVVEKKSAMAAQDEKLLSAIRTADPATYEKIEER